MARARRPAGAPTRRSSASAPPTPTARKHDPFASRMPDHSVVHRYARCLSYPEWGVGTVAGIYFTGEGDDVQQWARVKFAVGVRTVPAGSLQFVDFSKPDPGAERVQRFLTAAQHAMAEGDYALAAQRLVYARDAEPRNPSVLRLMTLAFWQAGEPRRGGPRRARLGARRRRAPGAAPLRRADLRGHGRDRPRRRGRRPRRGARTAATRTPGSASAACACGSWTARRRSRRSSTRAASGRASRRCSTWRSPTTWRATSAREVTATEQATMLDGSSAAGLGAPRARARAHRPGERRDRGRRARAAPDGATRRSRTCSSACARPQPRVLPAA